MAGRTVRVGGIPTDIPPERVADKLTIHFLRARNGGGEIADIHIVAGSPACALVTFEDAGVAQRVLAVKNHVLLVGGKAYPLTVTAHAAKLSPDEVFVRVCMIVDYGRLVDGKTLLRSLRRRYSNVQFSFDSKETLCTVKGPFTELQAFSQELLSSQQAGEAPLEEAGHLPAATGASASQQGSRSPLPEPKVEKQLSPGQEASEPPLHRDPVDGEVVEQLEDFSLVMDADIYLYMQRFCSSESQQVLRQHQVDMVDVSSDGIAILYLQASPTNTGNVGALVQARLALLQLYQQLEASLRKEKILKAELSGEAEALQGELQKLWPLLLCHADERHLYLIGNLVDVSQAKQYLQVGSGGRRAAGALRTSDASQVSYTAALPRGDARPGKAKPTVAAPPPRLSHGTLEFKGEHKLAANFSLAQHEGSLPSAWPAPVRSAPLTGLVQHSGSWLREAGAPGQSDPAPAHRHHHLLVSAAGTRPAAEVEQMAQKDWERRKEGSLLLRPKTLSLFAGGKESPGPVKPQPMSEVSAAFKSLSLFDTTGTCSALDSKAPAAPLRRSNSFSVPTPKASDTPRDPSRAASGGRAASEELSLDPMHWAYLKDVHGAVITGLCREGGVLLSERRGSDGAVLTLTAEDRAKLLQTRWKMEALCRRVCPALVCQSFSYSELDVDGPGDEALTELCGLLQGCSEQVRVSKDRYNLHLLCPKDTLLSVNEAFQRFLARRRSMLRLSSPSPGPEGSPYTANPSPTGQVKPQDPAQVTEQYQSREGLQQPEVSGPPERDPLLDGADTRSLSGPGWSATKTSSHHQAVGRVDLSYRSHSQDGQGGSGHLDAGVAGRQSLSLREPQDLQQGERPAGEPEAARVKRVLPDRFQLARDKSRGGPGEAGEGPRSPAPVVDGAPRSLPVWLSSCPPVLPATAATEQPPKPGQEDPESQEERLLPAGEGDRQETGASEREPRGSSPGREADEHKLGTCEACRSSRTATCRAPCGHSLCRTCFAADDTPPACCRSGRAIKGTFKVVTLSQSLPGYFRDPTLKIIYDIPDGVQEAGDPRPGRPYRGGRFQAFLPDNREGKKISQLLQKAFEQGLTFQLQSYDGEERVAWHLIPHKTSFDKGKARKGYPDAQYLHQVGALLRNLGIE